VCAPNPPLQPTASRARSGLFDVILCSALAVAERHIVRPHHVEVAALGKQLTIRKYYTRHTNVYQDIIAAPSRQILPVGTSPRRHNG
jgi:hypothetical protein